MLGVKPDSPSANGPATGDHQAVEHDPWPSTYDRDLDVPQRPDRAPDEPLGPYRRLVANPLLTIASCVAAIVLMRVGLQQRTLPLFLAAIGLLFGAPFFLQFHCLDCGVTGWLLRSKRHACPPALARWREGRQTRWRMPEPKTQLILWIYVLVSLGSLLFILFGTGR
jgi:hypothetical protein